MTSHNSAQVPEYAGAGQESQKAVEMRGFYQPQKCFRTNEQSN